MFKIQPLLERVVLLLLDKLNAARITPELPAECHPSPLRLRFTLDGMEVMKGQSACTATFKLIEFPGHSTAFAFKLSFSDVVRAPLMEWIIGSVLCNEDYDNVAYYFGDALKEIQELSVLSLLHY